MLKLFEKDYERYKLNIWQPETVLKTPVPLPKTIFYNVANVFGIFYRTMASPSTDNIEELMRAHIFTRLFILKNSARTIF